MALDSEILELISNKKMSDEDLESMLKLSIYGSRFNPDTKQFVMDLLTELKNRRPKLYENIKKWLRI